MFKIETESRANPFMEVLALAWQWWLVGAVSGAAMLAGVQSAYASLREASKIQSISVTPMPPKTGSASLNPPAPVVDFEP